MGYMRETFRFIKENFIHLALSAILPAVILAFYFDPSRKFSLLLNLNSELNFKYVFINVSYVNGWIRFGILIVLLLLWTTLMSSVVGAIERKMKYGDFYPRDNFVKFFLRKINNNFLHVLKLAIFYLLIIELLSIVDTLFTYMWVKVCGSISMPILTFITQCIHMIAFLVIVSYTMLILPNMTIKGYSLRSSIRESVRSLSKKKFIKILLTLSSIVIISMLPLLGHRLLIRFYNYTGSGIVQWILTFTWYMFFTMFIPVYMYTAFFDIEDIEREDIIKNNRYGEQQEEL